MVTNFHFSSFGFRYSQKACSPFKFKTGVFNFDNEDCLNVIKNSLPENRLRDQEYILKIQQYISNVKNNMSFIQHEIEDEFAPILAYYEKTLRAYNAVDLDDLIALPVQILKKEKSVLSYWQHKIRYLLIDEYQDSNRAQNTLIKLLTEQCSFTVVGDDDQSIYAWRGAKPEQLVELAKDYPQLKIIKLEQNYRSTAEYSMLQIDSLQITRIYFRKNFGAS